MADIRYVTFDSCRPMLNERQATLQAMAAKAGIHNSASAHAYRDAAEGLRWSKAFSSMRRPSPETKQ